MKENFSKRIQNIIKISKEEAIRLGHSYVGSEHLLLGLIKSEVGLSKKIFQIYDIDLKKTVSRIEDLIKTSGGTITLGHLPLTRRAERILRNSFKESLKLSAPIADDEHLLLALLSESEGVAFETLTAFSIDYETVKDLIDSNDQNQTAVNQNLHEQEIKPNSKTPTLDHFSRDLTFLANNGKLDPVLGRENEIERLAQILTRRKKNNPVLIGEPGVGKTAIIEGLANQIICKTVPRVLHNQRILSLDLASIVAGTKYRGQFEERLKNMMDELEKSENIIIFIDELHTIVGAGGAGGSLDASNMLKPALARGDVKCIGATTLNEYMKVIEKDGALDRRFQKIIVNPPTLEESVNILNGLKSKYEDHHFVKYTNESIKACVYLSDRYISDKFLPDKAIDVLDEAGARAHMFNLKVPKKIILIEDNLKKIREEKEVKVNNQQFEKAAVLRDSEKKLFKRLLKEQKKKWNEDEKRVVTKIKYENIADVVSVMTGIPLSKITDTENTNLIQLNKVLGKYIIGQNEAINSISRAIKRSRVGLSNPNKPIGVFLFLGPTGIGKTELAKRLALNLFPNKNSLVKIDLSEYGERFSISRLIGAPPGYVGYEEGGELTEKIRVNPHSVILLDEIEKGHPAVFNVLLQIFDEGVVTDGFGRKINFKNTVIIMTSNMGTNNLKNYDYGFGSNQKEQKQKLNKIEIMDKVRSTFSPELINRIDESIIFNPLDEEDVYQIIDLQVSDLVESLKKMNLKLRLNKTAKRYIAIKSYDPRYGVRLLRRRIQKYLEDPIADMILKRPPQSGTLISVKYKKNQLSFDLFQSKSTR